MERLSLLFPEGLREAAPVAQNENLIKSLELSSAFYMKDEDICDYLTTDIEVIRYRQQTVKDVLEIPELGTLLEGCAEKLETVTELIKLRPEKSASNEISLYSIKEAEIFIDFISFLYDGFGKIKDRLRAPALKSFCDLVAGTYESEVFTALKKGVEELTVSARSIKSITLGINLDARMQPYESGIVAVNEKFFHSGDIVSRFMRMESKKDDMLTLAPLSAAGYGYSGAEKGALDYALIGALSKIVAGGFKGWRDMMHKYFQLGTSPYLLLLPELKFLKNVTRSLRDMKRLHLPLCYPEICEGEACFEARGLYHPAIAKSVKDSDSSAQVVLNDVTFDKEGMIYVLTGPNRGGKSVLLCAVGAAQLMFQLGLPVPAESMRISPVDGIFTHLPRDAGSSVGKGRFGEECDRLQDMLSRVNENSLVLLDESLSGTNSYEAAVIAEEIITAMSVIGCRGIFATHLFELAKEVHKINAHPDGVSKVDNLVMGIDGSERTFKAERKEPDGMSYARDIADKYGLSVQKILESKKEQDNV